MATKTASKPATNGRATKPATNGRAPKPTKTRAAKRWRSRAVVRNVEAGSSVSCASCGERVKFQAKIRHQQVICNVYVKGVWNRVEHYHAPCYLEAGSPFGEAAA